MAPQKTSHGHCVEAAVLHCGSSINGRSGRRRWTAAAVDSHGIMGRMDTADETEKKKTLRVALLCSRAMLSRVQFCSFMPASDDEQGLGLSEERKKKRFLARALTLSTHIKKMTVQTRSKRRCSIRFIHSFIVERCRNLSLSSACIWSVLLLIELLQRGVDLKVVQKIFMANRTRTPRRNELQIRVLYKKVVCTCARFVCSSTRIIVLLSNKRRSNIGTHRSV